MIRSGLGTGGRRVEDSTLTPPARDRWTNQDLGVRVLMNETPAFNVRSYPAFRMARLYRLYVDRDALYLIRMRGVIGSADAGSRYTLHPGGALVGALLRWWAGWSQDAAARELDARGPREMLDAHRLNLRVEPGEVVES